MRAVWVKKKWRFASSVLKIVNMNFLEGLIPGRVRCLFSTMVEDSIGKIRTWAKSRELGHRIVFFYPGEVPRYGELIDQIVMVFAEASLADWPDWYGSPGLFAESTESAWRSLSDDLTTRTASKEHRTVHLPWLKRAVASCRSGKRPWISEYNSTVQVQQLSLTLATEQLTLVVAGQFKEDMTEGRLRGLAQVLEWVCRKTNAQVVAVLPREWLDRQELGSITSNHFVLENAKHAAIEAKAADERVSIVCPIIGRPHPASPGEQKLAERIARDPMLNGLFEFNVRVITRNGDRFLVDLVWSAGRLVVEIDGFGFHSTAAAFSSDRRRDAELVLSDFIVLRLPHDEVVGDVELAVDRVREFVRYRQQKPVSGELT
jgi:very-short-patch-repair endonuclease